MMRRTLAGGWLLALVASLVACGGGGSGGGADGGSQPGTPAIPPASPGNDYFPLATGNRWLYQVTENGAPVIHQVDVDATTTVDGQQRTSLATSTTDGTVVDVSAYGATSAGVTAFPSVGDSVSVALGAYTLLKLPSEPGDTFVQVDKTIDSSIDADSDGVHEQVVVLSTVQVVERAPLTTPAGSFPNALRMRTTLLETVIYSRSGARVSAQTVSSDWFVAGVGLVRRDLTTSQNGQQLASSSTLLLAYRVGTTKGGTGASVTSVAPDDTRVHDGGIAVIAGFDLPMDASSLNVGGLTVSDAQGTAIAGSVVTSLDGMMATFVPADGWHSGSYTATVSTRAIDRVGNAATRREWSFTLDTVAPALVLASPANGTIGMATDARPTFTFSEALDPATVTSGAGSSVTITDDTTGLVAPAAMTFDGVSTIAFAPATYWVHDHSYTVNFPAGIADKVGNRLGNAQQVHFSTAPGAFAPPTALTPSLGRQPVVAFGKVDGDAYVDVVWAAWDDSVFPWQMRLFVRRGQADGSFAPASEPVAAAMDPCSVFTIAIGDTNSDGRNDIVLGGSCGIRVLVQDANGGFSVGPRYPLPGYDYAATILLADVNGDGRLDMLSAGNSSAFRVWTQTASGTFVETASIETGLGSLTGLTMADLDGDGINDIVAWSIGMQTQRLAVLSGLSGGGFGAPTSLPTGDGWPSGVAIGDVDGDGRPDLVASIQNGSVPRVIVLHQAPDHTFSVSVTMMPTDPVSGIALLDVEADGKLDLVLGHDNALAVMRPLGDGRFGPEDFFGAPAPEAGWSMAVGPRDTQGRALVQFNGKLFVLRTLLPVNAIQAALGPVGGHKASLRLGLTKAQPRR